MESKARITIISDGTSDGTQVLADGKEIACRRLSFHLEADGVVTVTLDVYADEVSVDGHLRIDRVIGVEWSKGEPLPA